MNLPTLSIVVPNYNGGATIARTLQSLLDQQYPKLQIIVIDGQSTDQSVQVIKQFEPHLSYWVSEKDRGQSDAINKGFARCTGQVVNWLCSDDILLPNALLTVGQTFAEHPEVDIVAGAGRFIYQDDRKNYLQPLVMAPTLQTIPLMPLQVCVAQAACFYKRELLNRPGPLRTDLNYVMDAELWVYFTSQSRRWHCLDQILSEAVEGLGNKTSQGGQKIARELEQVYRQYFPERISLMFWQRRLRNPLACFIYRHRNHRQIWRLQRWADRLDRWLGRYYGPQRVKALEWRWFYLS